MVTPVDSICKSPPVAVKPPVPVRFVVVPLITKVPFVIVRRLLTEASEDKVAVAPEQSIERL